MKSRKQLTVQELIQETVNQLQRRFSPKPVAIKLATEKLIEKEYLERDDNDRKVLRYLVSCGCLRTRLAQLLTLACRHKSRVCCTLAVLLQATCRPGQKVHMKSLYYFIAMLCFTSSWRELYIATTTLYIRLLRSDLPCPHHRLPPFFGLTTVVNPSSSTSGSCLCGCAAEVLAGSSTSMPSPWFCLEKPCETS